MTSQEKAMAATILKYEDDRTTGPDSLRVLRLPKEDKGGQYEICGICDGIEPQTFHHIKDLLDQNKKQDAWDACLQYLLDNTKAVRAWIGNDKHPSIEFFLRDHYFNSGRKNTMKILQRALNALGATLTDDGLPGPKTSAALKNTLDGNRDKDLLKHLYENRLAFYKSCKQDPTFGRGWDERTRNAYAYAGTLA